jgi:hypothetical protein
VLADSLKNALPDVWNVFEEMPLASTDLKLHQVPDEKVQLALDVPDLHVAEAVNVQLDRWQPDCTLISWKRKRIAVLELTRQSRPSDMLNVQLEEAYRCKKRKYGPIKSAFYHFSEGWTIEILPWVIGIQGRRRPRGVGIAAWSPPRGGGWVQ